MCGITGYYSINNNAFTKDDLMKMTDSLLHRGPDASGYFIDNNVGLGHRRLSIIDLSDKANQPMQSACGRYVIVYNGEVYNFKEIEPLLNIKTRTSSDTEIIIEAFAKWGVDFVSKLNGMFAIAIYDKVEKEFFLFRDRIGIKPIFYFWDKNNFVFASELKALLKLDFIFDKRDINKTAINEYLHLGYIPEPKTIYNNIYKFPAGSYLRLKNNDFQIAPYWDIDSQIKAEVITDYNYAKKELKEKIIQSVKYRLISDVPFGTFLSGGIDSSLVTAVAQSLESNPVKTFSIGFKESKYNESEYARKVAQYLGTEHHEFVVSYKDAIELIPDIINTYDEPYADSSAIPTMLVSMLARQYVTMTLSGDGGDELFHGYGAYLWAKRLSNPLIKAFRYPIAAILSKLGNKYKRVSHLFEDNKDINSHIFSQEQYFFSQNDLKLLLKSEYLTGIYLSENVAYKRNLLPQERQAIFDLKNYLKDDLLVKVDRATMKYSLETRVPLLDYNIVEFALNLSPDFKIKGNTSKYILKDVLYDFVPAKYFNRPKWGFSIPLAEWLRKDLNFLINDYLSEDIIKKYNIVDYNYVNNIINKFYKGENYLYNRLWLLIVLHKWLKDNKI